LISLYKQEKASTRTAIQIAKCCSISIRKIDIVEISTFLLVIKFKRLYTGQS